MNLTRENFLQAARADFEFTRETRYLSGLLKVDLGSECWALSFANGNLVGIVAGESVPDSHCQIVVAGTPDQWDALLEQKPRPFYQCLQSAAVKHGMNLSVSDATFAYLPALNRMTTLMRNLKNGSH